MTSDLPLRGPAIYNPHLLSREELTGLFVARQALLNELLEDLRRTPAKGIPQHQLLVGVRGMGKTMLLRRLQVAVEKDNKLSKIWLPLAFPEEQYNVANLADFWLNCLDALSDTLEARGDRERVEELDSSIDSLRKLPLQERTGQALRLLQEAGRKHKRRLILLVDNADLIFDRIGAEEWALREALSSPHSFAFVGASSVVAESTYQYGKAFYDFFKVHELAGLSLEETESLLKKYAAARGDAEVEKIVRNEPGRIKTLHNLTGGNPRTLVLLYNVLAAGEDGDARSDLEQLLDLCTPLYKARFEEMPAQAQKIVHALALRWDPATAADLAEDTGLDINIISGQLGRLSRQGIVQKVPYDPDSKTGFQVGERFFNIWYLMRASRRVRRRLIWLVEFLKAFYSHDELEQRALKHLGSANSVNRERYAEFSFALAAACQPGPIRGALEFGALKILLDGSGADPRLRELFELELHDEHLRDRGEHLRHLKELEERILLLFAKDPGVTESVLQFVLGSPIPMNAKQERVSRLENAEGAEREVEIERISAEYKAFSLLMGASESARRFFQAFREGKIVNALDFEGAVQAEVVEGKFSLAAQLAALCLLHEPENTQAAGCLARSIDSCRSLLPWLLQWALRGVKPGGAEFETSVAKIRDLENGDPTSLVQLATLLCTLCRLEPAELAAHMALALEPSCLPALEVLIEIWEKQGRSPGDQMKTIAFSKPLDGANLVVECAARADDEMDLSKAAFEYAKGVFSNFVDKPNSASFREVLAFCSGFILLGQESLVARIFDELELSERWRPLRAALEARIQGSRNYLKRVSPEVRRPAIEILDELDWCAKHAPSNREPGADRKFVLSMGKLKLPKER